MKLIKELDIDMPTAVFMKKTIDSLNRVYIFVGILIAILSAVFILIIKQPVLLTPLLLIITGVLFMVHRWFYQLEGENWIGPIFIMIAMVLILLGKDFINWYSWGGFSAATIIWYVCLDRHLKVHQYLQSIAFPDTEEDNPIDVVDNAPEE